MVDFSKPSTVHIWGEFYEDIIKPKPLYGTSDLTVQKADSNRDAHFILDNMGRLFVVGGSEHGLLGLGPDKKHVSRLQLIAESQNVAFKDFSVGSSHVLAVSNKNELYSWGRNDYGQLGLSGDEWYPAHVTVSEDDVSFIKVLAVENSSFAITSEGDVWSWGENTDGLLGLNTKQNVNVPQKIPQLQKVVDLQCRFQMLNKQNTEPEIIRMMFAVSECGEWQPPKETLVHRQTNPNLSKIVNHETSLVAQIEKRLLSGGSSNTGRIRQPRNETTGVSYLDLQFYESQANAYKTFRDMLEQINSKYNYLLQLDKLILFRVFEDRGKRIGKLNLKGIIDEWADLTDQLLKLSQQVDQTYEPNSFETDMFRISLQSLNDALSLRKINIATAKMKIYHEKMKNDNFFNVLKFVRDQQIESIPNSIIRARWKYRSIKICKKLKANGENFVALHNGMGELTSNTLVFVVDSIATQADLWGVVNNALGKLGDSDYYNGLDKEQDREIKIIRKIWRTYKTLQSWNLDKLFSERCDEIQAYDSTNDFISNLLTFIDTKLTDSENELVEIMGREKEACSLTVKKFYCMVMENVELRKMLTECNRRIMAMAT